MRRFLLRFWRWVRAEIVFGFLIATVFWTGILGWQAAYAPTDAEKQKCYDAAAHSGHKSEECKSLWERTTSDPVAFFTLVLAISTIGLWGATIFLYRAGERQFRHARRASAIQSRDMQASIESSNRGIAVAGYAAEAAHESNRITKRTAERQLRAYIGIVEGAIFWHGEDKVIRSIVTIKNFGQTPAYGVRCWMKLSVSNEGPPFERLSGEFESSFIIGPSAFFNVMNDIAGLPERVLPMIESKHTVVYVWGRVEYRDAFDQQRFFNFRYATNGPLENINFAGETGVGWGLTPHSDGHQAN